MASDNYQSIDDSEKNNQILSGISGVPQNCDWELKISHGLAVSLGVLEAKRLILLALEMIIETPVLQFSGGIKPIILSLIDVALGFPCVFASIYSIRKRQRQPCYSKVKMLFNYVELIIIICVVLNIATLASIGYYVNVRQKTLASVFNTSMHLYKINQTNKYHVDWIQIKFRCCGHTSYADWFHLDWQRHDYQAQSDNSDKQLSDLQVPFSCCNLHSVLTCVHTQIMEIDLNTINVYGCSKILNSVLLRIVIFGYVMTAMFIITQGLLLYYIVKIAQKPPPQTCRSDHVPLFSLDTSPRCFTMNSSSSCTYSSTSESLFTEYEEGFSLSIPRNRELINNSPKRLLSSSRYRMKRRTRNYVSDSSNDDGSSSSSPSLNRISRVKNEKDLTARIKPTTYKQNQVSQTRLSCLD